MKKILALVLALVLALSMTAVAFADDTITGGIDGNGGEIHAQPGEDGKYVDTVSVNIGKLFKLANAQTFTSSPAVTFNYTIAVDSVANTQYTASNVLVPTLSDSTAVFGPGVATADGVVDTITVTLPEYDKVGVFKYKITESAFDYAGVTKDVDVAYLVVTAVQEESGIVRVAAVHIETEDGEKVENSTDTNETYVFENTYSSADMTISKTVDGTLGDKSYPFEFKVKLEKAAGKTYPSDTVTISGGSYTGNPTSIKYGEETSIWLKDGDTIILQNVPYDTTYTVVEVDPSNADNTVGTTGGTVTLSDIEYDVTVEGNDGKVSSDEESADFTNDAGDATVDTGIVLDNLPYIVLMGLVVLAGVVMMMKKRSYND